MAELASFWVGSDLGPIEMASLRSFLRWGDRVTLYSPHEIRDLPTGVVWRDAEEIMPSRVILRHRRTGSPALHSDLFRYALLAQTDFIWVDLDIIALRTFDSSDPWLFGFESDNCVNGAVLRLPHGSATLAALSRITPELSGIPPFVTGFRRLRYMLRHRVHLVVGDGLTIDRWPWGAVGPRLLTHLLRETGEISHAKPIDALYAVPLKDAGRFLEPGKLSREDLPADAWAVHLWNNRLKHVLATRYGGQIPAGSFLDSAIRGTL